MGIELKILGIGSASPVYNRHPSAQVFSISNNHYFLIDCGETTQFQLLRYRISHTKLTHIFITHLHGDHYLGLVGLISTMHLLGRKKALHIYGPKGLAEIITVQLKYSETVITYPLYFTEVNTKHSELIVEHGNYTIHTIPLSHRIDCCGYLFREKPKRRRILMEKIPFPLAPTQKTALKNGGNIQDENGKVYLNEDFTLPPKKSLAFAYCSDTAYLESILPIIKNVDLLYHEATFSNEQKERAGKTFHSTAEQAATIALKAEVGQLIIGHFSSRYQDLTPLLEEAKAVFSNVELAEEGRSYHIND